jgi:hypothetical protein
VFVLGAQTGWAWALGERWRGRRELPAATTVATITVATISIAALWLPRASPSFTTTATGPFGPSFVAPFVATATLVGRHLGDGLKGDA